MSKGEIRTSTKSGFDACMLETLGSVIGIVPVNRLLETFGSFWGIVRCPPDQLRQEVKTFNLSASDELCERLEDAASRTRRLAEIFSEAQRRRASVVETTSDLVDHFRRQLRGLKIEQMRVVLLDQQRRITHSIPVAAGTAHRVQTPIRELIGPVLQFRAAAWALGHNHPTGDATPSSEDFSLTRQLGRVSSLIDIPLVANIILSDTTTTSTDFTSMRLMGYLDL